MWHSEIGGRIIRLLGQAVDRNQAGKVYPADVGIVIPNGNIRSPDVCFCQ